MRKSNQDFKAIQSTFSKHSGIKLEINNRRTIEKSLKIENYTFSNNCWVKEEFSKKIEIHTAQW